MENIKGCIGKVWYHNNNNTNNLGIFGFEKYCFGTGRNALFWIVQDSTSVSP